MSLRPESPPQPGGPRLLARPEEVHSIAFHLLVLAAYAVAFWIWLHPASAQLDGPAAKAAFVVSAALLLGWVSGIDLGVNFHNHAHRRIFQRGWQNRWFGRFWGVTSGWPDYFWRYCHVVVHHRHLLEERDWTLPRQRPAPADCDSDAVVWESYQRYCLAHWPWRYAVELWAEFRPGGRASRAVQRRAAREFAVFCVLWSIPFWIDVPMALCLWVLPHWVANVLVLAPGMIAQHAGRARPDGSHEFRHSNTYLSPFFNLAMFNIGYHAEHHTYPYVHWADLPGLHAQLKPRLIEEGAHVMPFGYFRGGLLLSRGRRARAEFDAQHPDYVDPGQAQVLLPRPPRELPRAPLERRAESFLDAT